MSFHVKSRWEATSLLDKPARGMLWCINIHTDWSNIHSTFSCAGLASRRPPSSLSIESEIHYIMQQLRRSPVTGRAGRQPPTQRETWVTNQRTGNVNYRNVCTYLYSYVMLIENWKPSLLVSYCLQDCDWYINLAWRFNFDSKEDNERANERVKHKHRNDKSNSTVAN